MTQDRISKTIDSVRATFALLGAACSLLLASPAAAQVGQVYFTYGPADTGPLTQWAAGVQQSAENVPLHLWVQGGGATSTGGPCQLGATGNEICAINLTLHGNGHFEFTDFAPNQSFDSAPSAVPILGHLTPSQMNLNALDFGTPGIGNRYLGVVSVTPIGDPSQEDAITVSGGVMRSNMEMWDVVARNVVVPEPAIGSALAIGVLGLALLRRTSA